MGSTVSSCLCKGKGKPSNEDLSTDHKDSKTAKPTTVQPSTVSESIANIHTSAEILDDTFKAEITQAIEEHVASVPADYQKERDRLVNEMQRMAPERYLGLLYSEYPHVNGLTVNEMAKRFVASKEVKQRLVDEINERMESSFQSRTTDWKSSSREIARPTVRAFIEKLVNEAFDRVKFE